MYATTVLLSLLLVCVCSPTSVVGQVPYSAMGDSATQYQHRWTDELEFAMLHQQMQPAQQQQSTHTTLFDTQQSATSLPANRITDTRRPHAFTRIPATATERQQPMVSPNANQPRVQIPLSNIVVHSPPSSTAADFDTAAADTQGELVTQAVLPFNETIVRRARARCSLSCNERLLDVTGEGRVRINSTRTLIRATIEFKEQLTTAVLASSASAARLHSLLLSATNQTAAAAAVVVGYLQSDEWAGRVWQLHTTSMLVEPIYQYVNGSQLTNGYRASLSFSLQVSTKSASAVLTGMLERGVTRIDSVGYEAAEADTSTARQKAVKRAVKDALQQATTAVHGMLHTLRKLHRRAVEDDETDKTDDSDDSRGGLQVVSMRVTGLTLPVAQVFYPSQTRIFGVSSATSRLFVDESVLSIPIIAEDKVITATVLMKIRF